MNKSLLRTYRVYYTRTIGGQVDIEATSPTEAQEKFESNGGNRTESEREEPIEVYDVEAL